MARTAVWSKKALVLGLFSFVLGIGVLLVSPGTAKAETVGADVSAKINGAIAISLTNCDATDATQVSIELTPTPTGEFKSNCQTVNVNTNTPGYTLTAKAANTALEYINPTTISPTPSIASTSHPVAIPGVLSNDTWGFAVENNGSFDTAYTIDNANNTYAGLPTSDTAIYETDQFPLPQTNHKFFYATKATTNNVAGTYVTTVTYTAIGAEVPEPPTYPKVGNGVSFQETTLKESESCSSLPIYNSSNPDPASTVIMTDNRNGQDYRVRRLQDGKCWMIDNLKIELTPGMTLTSTDTNVTTDITVYFTQDGTSAGTTLTGMTGNFTTSGYMTRDGTNTSTSPNYDAWRQADPSSTTRCLNNTGANTTNTYAPGSLTGCGYLYNYYTTTAGSLPQSSGAGYATGSICPAGWHLPYNTSTNDFGVLNNSMQLGTPSASNTNSAYYANWLPDGSFQGSLSGYYTTGFGSQGTSGFYWSARAGSATNAYSLYFNYSYVSPGNGNNTKNDGYSVRCAL